MIAELTEPVQTKHLLRAYVILFYLSRSRSAGAFRLLWIDHDNTCAGSDSKRVSKVVTRKCHERESNASGDRVQVTGLGERF